MTVLDDRWASGQHVGAARPTLQVFVRTGIFKRSYWPWAGPVVDARIYGEAPTKPWMPQWTPTSAYVEIPNILSCGLTQDYDSNGIAVASIQIENIVYNLRTGPLGDIYHLIERGYLAPFRGSSSPLRGQVLPPNDWYLKLVRNSQIKVLEGYGDATEPTFTGLIDDCDMTSKPDRIQLTARDFGQALTDQHVFGWNKSKQIPEPVVFEAKGQVGADGSTGVAAGHAAEASSTRDGHPARFVTDQDVDSIWISGNTLTAAATEWVQIRLPKGRYESFAIHNAYPNMEVFLGVFARDDGLGGEKCEIDDREIEEGFIFASDLTDPARGGIVPGANGGWPYIKHWSTMSDSGHVNTLGCKLELGDDSVLRIGYRNLRQISDNIHRAGCVRLKGIRRTGKSVNVKPVGEDAEASSSRSGSPPSAVLDTDRSTAWISDNHPTAAATEWVEIHVPQARYDSVSFEVAYPGMECYIGIYARDRTGGKKSRVDGVDVDEGFIGVGLGTVPGANGGWPYIKKIDSVPHDLVEAEKYLLDRKFELGDNSVIRLGFRNLSYIQSGVYRASVIRFKALTRSGVTQPAKVAKRKIIEVGDVSEIVKVALRWAGFAEWVVESTGVGMKGSLSFNRADTLMDVIKKVQDATGYIFYIAPPSGDDLSIGVPHFESNRSLRELTGLSVIRDTDLLTGIQAKATDEPLGSVIRVRGKESKQYGKMLGQQTDRRLLAVYRPPWHTSGRLAGLLKHVIHTEPKARHTDECMVIAMVIGLQEALIAAAVEAEVPGTPRFALNTQIALIDTGTGLNTRIYVARRHTEHQAGRTASWKLTLGGALLDTVDVQGVTADLKAQLRKMGSDVNSIDIGDPFGAETS